MRTLLLNLDYSILDFISERRAVKLLLNGKVEIISIWDGRKISYGSGYMDHPSVIRMKYPVNRSLGKTIFSKKLVMRRDNYSCAYCGKKLKNNDLTIDHILPKSLGGKNTFLNCVTACFPCNSRKGNRALEETGMTLLIKPYVPTKFLCQIPLDMEWHQDWRFFTG